FTNRQLVALTTFSDLVNEAHALVLATSGDTAYSAAISLYLSFALSKIVDNSSSLCVWMYMPSKEGTAHTFARAALPMIWDFGEANQFSPGPSDYLTSCEWIGRVLDDLLFPESPVTKVTANDAARRQYKDLLITTDPPYYDNVPYSDLSDFFYVWLRRCLSGTFPEFFSTVLT